MTSKRLGWFGEALPDGLTLGPEKPLYLWDTLKGLTLELVYLDRGCWIGRECVTRDQYGAFCRAKGRTMPNAFPDTARLIDQVSWHDAKAFCAWAGVALPTEEEWEKAHPDLGSEADPWEWCEDIGKTDADRVIRAPEFDHGDEIRTRRTWMRSDVGCLGHGFRVCLRASRTDS